MHHHARSRSSAQRAAVLALLATATWASPLLGSTAHDELCEAMAGERPDLRAARAALEAGASPDEACSYPYTARRIHAAGAFMSVITGGLWLMTPVLDEDLLTEPVQRTHRVTPMRHAADLRHEGLLSLLLGFGGDIDTLDGAFAAAVGAAELDWAEHLSELGAERSLGIVPTALLHRGRVERLLSMEPDLTAASLSWSGEALDQMAADPVVLDLLLDAGLNPGSLRGGFAAAVTQDELDLAAHLAQRGAPRRLEELDTALLADEATLQRVLSLDPDLEGLRLGWGKVHEAEVNNPHALEQLVAGGYPLEELAFQAAHAHRWEDLDRVLDMGFDIDTEWNQRFDGRMLNEAVDDGDREAVAALLDRGAGLFEDAFHDPVEQALRNDDDSMVALLLDRMTDRAEATDRWRGILGTAIIAGSLERAAWTLEDGRLGGAGLTRHAARAIETEHRAMAELLLDHTNDRQAAVDAGLRSAAMHNSVDGVTLALELGADPRRRGPEGQTALNCAAYSTAGDPPAVIALLVQHGAPVDGHPDQQVPPLHLAVSEGATASVEALLAHDASLTRLDGGGRTALALALEEARWEALGILARAGAPVEAWMLTEAAATYPYAPPEVVLAMAHGEHDASPRTLRRLARRVERREPELAEELRALARQHRSP